MSDISAVSSPGRKPKLPDRVRAAIRVRHYSPRTEQAYSDGIKRFVLFHGKRHPGEPVRRVAGPPSATVFKNKE